MQSGQPRRNGLRLTCIHILNLLRTILKNNWFCLVFCPLHPSVEEWKEVPPSASVCTHWNWNESGFHQAATAVVVIVRIGSEPKDNADQNATSSQKGELQHRQPKAAKTLVKLLGFRHLARNENVGMDRLT